MVKFLLERPIAVFMAFLACVIIGVVTYFAIPVSLLPAIDIPRITVKITADNTSARELENTATAPVRRQLQQVAGLNEMHSETHDGSAFIRMDFDYGVDIDLAFIAANEKIDDAMNSLPREISRPRVIKASATDIPVLYINMTLADNDDDAQFLQMTEIADNTLRRELEQLPQVAMVDVSGIPSQLLKITPDRDKLKSLGITNTDIESLLNQANATPGSMTVRDGYYEYNINVANTLRTADDVANLYFNKNNRLIRLGDVAQIELTQQTPGGYVKYNGKRAVALAVIKQNDENISSLKNAISETIENFSNEFPQYSISQSRNQTELLDATISGLMQNLILGLLLVFMITAVFMGDLKTPFIIGISILVALVMTFLAFYLFNVSLNIVSLSGLILAVGMMIDNSVIVTENITQWRNRNYDLLNACRLGTNEMITPLISSSLTTIAVFLPLIFMSGIAGAIFADQAFSITSGLVMSYITGIALLPVLYKIFFSGKKKIQKTSNKTLKIDQKLLKLYNISFDFVFKHKALWIFFTLLSIPVSLFLFTKMETEKIPAIDRNETMAKIEWNENITAFENAQRVDKIIHRFDKLAIENSADIGIRDYMLDDGNDLSQQDAELYFRTISTDEIAPLCDSIQTIINTDYPLASVEFYPPENIFEKIFDSSEPDLEIRLTPRSQNKVSDIHAFELIAKDIQQQAGTPSMSQALRRQTNLTPDRKKMALYNVDPAEVDKALEAAFKDNTIATLRSADKYIPIGISASGESLQETLSSSIVPTIKDLEGNSDFIPLANLIDSNESNDFKQIFAGKNGEYLPIQYENCENVKLKINNIQSAIRQDNSWDADFSGAFFSNSSMMNELIVILIISLIMMYFILCAQFESFLQPLIVLLEIPIDTAFALLILYITGNSLNIMSAIGIIVTCGIVVNDSILKLDAINTLRKEGAPLLEAIHTAGIRRLRPIIMTSLTTILAMVPILFSNDMGSQLQQPLAVAMIGSMTIGTLVSIFIIPLIYYLIYHHDKK